MSKIAIYKVSIAGVMMSMLEPDLRELQRVMITSQINIWERALAKASKDSLSPKEHIRAIKNIGLMKQCLRHLNEGDVEAAASIASEARAVFGPK